MLVTLIGRGVVCARLDRVGSVVLALKCVVDGLFWFDVGIRLSFLWAFSRDVECIFSL